MNRPLFVMLCCLALLVGCKKGPSLVNNDSSEGPPAGQDGSGCTSDRRCDGDICLGFGDGWRGGYCTTADCTTNGCNGDDAQCIEFVDGSSTCLDGCESNGDCRSGYRCRALDSSGQKVCFRHEGDGPAPGEIGADCKNKDDCNGDLSCDAEVRGGYCLKNDCDDCPRDSECADWAGGGGERCLQECDETRNCRVGFLCADGVCQPSQDVNPPFGFETTAEVLGISCGGESLGEVDLGTEWNIEYEVPAGISGYVVVPHVPTGALRPLSIDLPSGETLDLVSDYKHHNIRVDEFQFFDQESEGVYGEVALDWPILVPYTPDRADLLQSGTHTMKLLTTVAEPCVYVIGGTSGTVIDLNMIFVGLDGFSADSAPSDPDIQEVLQRMDEILGPAGLRLGDVQFYDAPTEVAERYSIVRDQVELRRATAFGSPRSESLDGHLNVDMFLVESLRLGGSLVYLGLSAGLPGPPGLHGNAANGLIFTGADIGSDNALVAHIMAHELGHYIGLRHTTEVVHNSEAGVEFDFLIGTQDPIADTPVCASFQGQGYNCPDGTNLMFPAAPLQQIDPVITEGQAAVLRSNPLFKPE